MPQITRFLVPVVKFSPGKSQARTRAIYSIVTELLEQIAGYDHVEMTVGTDFVDLAPFLAAGYRVKVANRHDIRRSTSLYRVQRSFRRMPRALMKSVLP
jgi:hypothetical protein